MRRFLSHGLYSTVFSTVYLVVGVNALLAVACAPFLVLLMTTDPSLSWPALAAAAVLCAPGIAAAFSVFRSHQDGEGALVRPFLRALRATWKKALVIGSLAIAVAVVAVGDVFVLAPTEYGMIVVPLLAVLAVLVSATGATALVVVGEAPEARLRDVLRVCAVLSVRGWHLTLVSLAVVLVQAGIVVAAPALGVGITASACLYVVWAGARRTLEPVLVSAAKAGEA